MKKILIVAAALCLMSSTCKNIDEEPETLNDEKGSGITVMTIDSCQYIKAQTGRQDGGVSIIHKENCPNPIHKRK